MSISSPGVHAPDRPREPSARRFWLWSSSARPESPPWSLEPPTRVAKARPAQELGTGSPRCALRHPWLLHMGMACLPGRPHGRIGHLLSIDAGLLAEVFFSLTSTLVMQRMTLLEPVLPAPDEIRHAGGPTRGRVVVGHRPGKGGLIWIEPRPERWSYWAAWQPRSLDWPVLLVCSCEATWPRRSS